VEDPAIRGFALKDPNCIPGSTYFNINNLPDMDNIDADRSLSVRWMYPEQIVPHFSVLLKGYVPDKRVSTNFDP
jgi:hypothetical protein